VQGTLAMVKRWNKWTDPDPQNVIDCFYGGLPLPKPQKLFVGLLLSEAQTPLVWFVVDLLVSDLNPAVTDIQTNRRTNRAKA